MSVSKNPFKFWRLLIYWPLNICQGSFIIMIFCLTAVYFSEFCTFSVKNISFWQKKSHVTGSWLLIWSLTWTMVVVFWNSKNNLFIKNMNFSDLNPTLASISISSLVWSKFQNKTQVFWMKKIYGLYERITQNKDWQTRGKLGINQFRHGVDKRPPRQ